MVRGLSSADLLPAAALPLSTLSWFVMVYSLAPRMKHVSLLVSILVLVDVPLECFQAEGTLGRDISFNPCFSGCASRRLVILDELHAIVQFQSLF